ncbi:MAG: hypothetical protein JNJ54_17655 [Myxococcaceae bacterium]|nr:hypothetical protein [Myxococcaceae bacterium]
MSRTSSIVVIAAALCALPARAEEKKAQPKLKGSMKQQAPKIDLGLPTFGSIPSGDGLKKVEEKPAADRPTTTSGQATYTIVSVQHGKGFIRTPTGSKPSAPYPAVTAAGSPLMTEKFTTVVRVKAPDKKTTSIEVVVLDPRGDTVMDANGSLPFKNEEADWTVDWDPTGIRAAGEFQVLVRLGGNPLGTFPLKVEAAPPK